MIQPQATPMIQPEEKTTAGVFCLQPGVMKYYQPNFGFWGSIQSTLVGGFNPLEKILVKMGIFPK